MMANNNLLTFVNNASSSIQDAMGKPPKKKRVVNVKKFVQSRVKRLDNAAPKPIRGNRPKATHQLSTKPVSSLLSRGSSCTWPDIRASPVSVVPNVSALSDRETTSHGHPTAMMTTDCDLRSYSAPDLFPSQPAHCAQPALDPELESLLSSLTSSPDPLSRHGSFESVYTTNHLSARASPSYNMPVSPYSDFSTDELDSAYSSPIESARLSSNCSPTSFPTIAETASSLPTWTSPLQSSNMSPEWPTVTASSCVQEIASEWMSSDSTSTTTTSTCVYDQGPPMTPTVSQLLEQYNTY